MDKVLLDTGSAGTLFNAGQGFVSVFSPNRGTKR
jgi:hypothetical protein